MTNLYTFSFLTGFGKVKEVKDLSETEKRAELERYFEYDDKILEAIDYIKKCGWAAVIFFLVGFDGYAWCFVVGIIFLLIALFAFKVDPVISDAQYNEWREEDEKKLREMAMNEILISESDLTGPVLRVRSTYGIYSASKVITDPEIAKKIGDWAYSSCEITQLFELEKQIMSHTCGYEIRTDVANDKETKEFYYKDVVDVSTTKLTMVTEDDEELTYNAFYLKNAGASELSIPLATPDDAEASEGNVLITGDVDNLMAHIRQNVRKFK